MPTAIEARLRGRLQRARIALSASDGIGRGGRLVRATGTVLAAAGPVVGLGQWCRVGAALAEVVGFRDGLTLLAPLGNGYQFQPGQSVEALGRDGWVWCGDDLRGRVLDELGNPLDGRGPWAADTARHLGGEAPAPLDRPRIDHMLPTGVRAIDAFCALGQGQRIGLFAGSGVGKSTLLGMMARGTSADVVVLCLVGERGREVGAYLETIGEECQKRTVVVASTSDRPAVCRARCADTAMTVAEFFRDQGRDVLLVMDSLTRYAHALREMGLAAGEVAAARGYPPSVFATMPRLLERAGRGMVGSITLITTVLVDGDDMEEPVADAARGLLDGHVVLARRLAERGQYPPVDIPASLSRLMPQVVTREHLEWAQKARAALSRAEEVADLAAMGAYQRGADPGLDAQVDRAEQIRAWVAQSPRELVTWDATWTGRP